MTDLAHYIDHTLLKADATASDYEQLCHEAIQFQFYSVCLPPSYIQLAQKILQGHEIKICTVVGFPLGYNSQEVKAFECHDSIKKGAHEIDMVINIGNLKSKSSAYVLEEIKTLANICHDHNSLLKVIVETCLLTTEEKKLVLDLCLQGNADFIKTSTGFSTSGALVEDIKLFKEIAGDQIKIKASGGIKSKDIAHSMIQAGANRLGTSSSVSLVS